MAWGIGGLTLLYLVLVLYVTINKDSIIRNVTRQLSEKIRGNVHVGNSELTFFRTFPNISVLLSDVKISDSLFAQHKKYTFRGREVYCSLSLAGLIKKKGAVNGVRIQNAELNLFTNSNGYTNSYLLGDKKPSKNDSRSAMKNLLKQVHLQNVTLSFTDSIKGKSHAIVAEDFFVRLKKSGDHVKAKCEMNLLIGGLAFNSVKGAYLQKKTVRGNFPFTYQPEAGALHFRGIILKIDGHPFTLSGDFGFGSPGRGFSLTASTTNANYDFLKSIFPPKIQRSLSLVGLNGRFAAKASVGGTLKGGDPLVIVNFSTGKTDMVSPFMDFKEAAFSGFFTNEVSKGLPRKDPNSRIYLSNFKAGWHSIPVNAKFISITNLAQPVLECELVSEFALDKLNEVMGAESLLWKKGRAGVNLVYSGPLVHDLSTPALISGKVAIDSGVLLYAPRGVEMKQVHAAMHFEKSDFFLDTLQAEVFGKPVRMNAEARGLLTLLNSQPDAARVLWNINAPELDLQPYMVLLQKKRKPTGRQESGIKSTSSKIDRVLDEGQLDLNLFIARLKFRKFLGQDVKSRITLLQDNYVVHEAGFNHAGGHVQLAGKLVQGSNGVHKAEIKSNLRSVDVKRVFESFDNFGQHGLVSENIRGQLDADINASLQVAESGTVIPSSARGTVKFSLTGGELISFEPVKKIQQFIFKNRDFENIKFAELTNQLKIEGSDIHINQMEIQSSVLTMFVDGVYSNRGNTDLQIRLPLSNLRKRGKDFNPENLDETAKKGSSILLRGRPGDDGNIRFKLDLFNKYRKENKIKK